MAGSSWDFDPDEESPEFDFSARECQIWGLTKIWEARQGSDEDRRALIATWRKDVAAYRQWVTKFWQTQTYSATIQRKYVGGSTAPLPKPDLTAIYEAWPELGERYEKGGELGIFQWAGCTPAQSAALTIRYEGKTIREVAARLGITSRAAAERVTYGEAKLRELLRGYTRIA